MYKIISKNQESENRAEHRLTAKLRYGRVIIGIFCYAELCIEPLSYSAGDRSCIDLHRFCHQNVVAQFNSNCKHDSAVSSESQSGVSKTIALVGRLISYRSFQDCFGLAMSSSSKSSCFSRGSSSSSSLLMSPTSEIFFPKNSSSPISLRTSMNQKQ